MDPTPHGEILCVYARAHCWHTENGHIVNGDHTPSLADASSEAFADMLMENRDFLFTPLAIWTSKAMSKERTGS